MQKMTFKKVAPLSVAALAAMGFAASAHAVSFKVSGQVDRAIIAADNGARSDVGFVDNTGSNTRVRFVGTQTMANGWTVGVDNEDAFRRNKSASWDIRHGGNGPQSVDIRQAKVWVQGPFGKLSLGQGDGAANSTTEVDLSGTAYLGGGIGTSFYMGGVTFVNSKTKQGITTVGSIYNHFDALSRVNRLRYDSPNFGPMKVAVSADENGAFEGALDFAASGTWGKAAAQFGYVNTGHYKGNSLYGATTYDPSRRHIMTASASYLANMGLNLTVSYSKEKYVSQPNKANPSNYFVAVGYRFGKNNFQVGYGETKDLLDAGSKAAAYNVSYVYDWTKSVQAYASYHLVDIKSLGNSSTYAGMSAKNVNAIFMGMRVKFM